ncbi:response regulator transcription factor [uncultured Faecalibaculum sp.]|uniref:response regulator transcription factor n=1 Tax=uncultured Faecalibaculum sp. TaxID=1729681 RepID=UPI00263859CD|nr:response regulator transcription factor [uncultured Faecalibaculum sp.]
MRICIVEDNRDLAEALRDALDPEDCQLCFTCSQGLAEYEKGWDLLMLDVRLPDGSGLDIARAARISSDVPILFLSSDQAETTMLEAFESGCDDYIVKPVRLAVLRKKVQALLQRSGYCDKLRFQDVILHPEKRLLEKGNHQLSLSPTETALLRGLFRHPCQTETLIRFVRQDTSRDISLETFSSRLSTLKKKLGVFDLTITGRRNTGYQLEEL